MKLTKKLFKEMLLDEDYMGNEIDKEDAWETCKTLHEEFNGLIYGKHITQRRAEIFHNRFEHIVNDAEFSQLPIYPR